MWFKPDPLLARMLEEITEARKDAVAAQKQMAETLDRIVAAKYDRLERIEQPVYKRSPLEAEMTSSDDDSAFVSLMKGVQ